MSKIGKIPIFIPKDLNIKIDKNLIIVKGKLGVLNLKIPEEIKLLIDNNKLYLTRNIESKKIKSLHGLYRVLIFNMIQGVTKGFKKELELVGVGYRAINRDNNILELNLGFSHSIMIQIPKEISVDIKTEKGSNFILLLKSYNKQLLGLVAAKIRSFRKPEPYKGKGIRYLKEEIRRKEGKTA
ncbi:50S ribosomal protein L6 [Blattabacterium cuenoti]|uniref:50S ribosomal protein L6 n=1 Tax=Blattabacterium cuenoti TaxID=1653831 RepID=UPI00163BB43C|nr:50S ribosomal protein L6 [Blattabacterium cuenoti]